MRGSTVSGTLSAPDLSARDTIEEVPEASSLRGTMREVSPQDHAPEDDAEPGRTTVDAPAPLVEQAAAEVETSASKPKKAKGRGRGKSKAKAEAKAEAEAEAKPVPQAEPAEVIEAGPQGDLARAESEPPPVAMSAPELPAVPAAPKSVEQTDDQGHDDDLGALDAALGASASRPEEFDVLESDEIDVAIDVDTGARAPLPPPRSSSVPPLPPPMRASLPPAPARGAASLPAPPPHAPVRGSRPPPPPTRSLPPAGPSRPPPPPTLPSLTTSAVARASTMPALPPRPTVAGLPSPVRPAAPPPASLTRPPVPAPAQTVHDDELEVVAHEPPRPSRPPPLPTRAAATSRPPPLPPRKG
jgi:hypothetical protein